MADSHRVHKVSHKQVIHAVAVVERSVYKHTHTVLQNIRGNSITEHKLCPVFTLNAHMKFSPQERVTFSVFSFKYDYKCDVQFEKYVYINHGIKDGHLFRAISVKMFRKLMFQ